MASQCWRSAKSCHTTETSSTGSKSTCQAWYRCETAGDYVIRWQCHAVNTTSSLPFTQCDEGQRARDATDCPPPVVCDHDPYDDDVHIANDLSSDLILAIALASFAVVAIMLIMASTYKYCQIRKRRHRRPHQPRQLYIRDFPYPVRYHNLWGANQHFYDVLNKKTTSSPVYSGPFQDVYFSRPYETSRKFEHLLSSSDDSIDDFPVSKSRHEPATRSGAKHKTDPSVVTGSFVFHQPGSAGVGSSHGVKEWSDGRSYSTKKDSKDNGSEANSECYHIYRGNLSRYHHHDNPNFNQHPKHHGKKDQQHLPDMSAEFLPYPRMSSISIPSYGHHQAKHKHSEKLAREHQLREEKTERFPGNFFDASSSRGSCGSISPYATGGCLDHSPKVHGRDQKKSRRGSPHSNSPDVISGHNFTNAFVRVGMNVYRSLQTRASSDGSVSSRDSRDHGRGKKTSAKHAKPHHDGNNPELSYDSFRNEHLREIATRGTASSSTLEAGFRHKTHDIDAPTHSRY